MSMGNLKSGIMMLIYACYYSSSSVYVIYIYVCVSLYTHNICVEVLLLKSSQPVSIAVGNKLNRTLK